MDQSHQEHGPLVPHVAAIAVPATVPLRDGQHLEVLCGVVGVGTLLAAEVPLGPREEGLQWRESVYACVGGT
eukprot:37380-Eustigmatos_ZCMA.PRE.1